MLNQVRRIGIDFWLDLLMRASQTRNGFSIISMGYEVLDSNMAGRILVVFN
ncbi:MAG: hypothetical protein ACJAS1_005421 [Oleiphilaceae bacterium]|jgi:hypothetical protein